MFERFRIKAALRVIVIALRETAADQDALSQAELMFFEPAFLVAPMMKRQRWSADQAMTFMVTDVILVASRQGSLAALQDESPAVHTELRRIYDAVRARAEGDPALVPCISRPGPDDPAPFAGGEE